MRKTSRIKPYLILGPEDETDRGTASAKYVRDFLLRYIGQKAFLEKRYNQTFETPQDAINYFKPVFKK